MDTAAPRLMVQECAYHGRRHSAEGVPHTAMVRKCCRPGCPVEGIDGGLVAVADDGENWWFCEDHACTSPTPLVRFR